MKVLILSNQNDPHAVSVFKHLEEMNVHVDFLHYSDFSSCRLSYSIISGVPHIAIQRASEVLDLRSYASIWHRRPGKFETHKFPEAWVQRMVEHETRDMWNGVIHNIPCLWVNHPRRDAECLLKLSQLEIASAVGLTVPETIVTNQPDEVREFFQRCSGKVIYKLIAEASGFYLPPYEAAALPTLPMREIDLNFINQVQYAPHLFQRYVDKLYDIRATVIGKQIFAGRIYSQAGKGKVDWRQDYSVKMEPTELPSVISDACLELMRRLRLNYSAIDFCETAEGEYLFLEINCGGQFLWLEERTGQPMAKALAELLAHQSPPLIEQALTTF